VSGARRSTGTIGGFHRVEVASIEIVHQDLDVASSNPCPLPISVQLADITRLEDGWLDGEGAVYGEAAIAQARKVFEALINAGALEMPYIYPSPDGAFRAEWNHPERDVVVTLDPSGLRLRLLAVDSNAEAPARREAHDATDDGIKALAASLESLLETDTP
jgi:hypothetical protein